MDLRANETKRRPPSQPLLATARKGKYTTIPQLTEQDVADIWFCVSQWIAERLSQGKGVMLLGLGTFSLAPENKGAHPTFNLSTSFLASHPVMYKEQAISSSVPIVSLNFTMLSLMANQDRHTVENCVKEIVNALSSEIKQFRPEGISLEFYGIGKLTVKSTKVRFRFFRAFFDNPSTMDGKSKNPREMCSRPVTVATFNMDGLDLAARPSSSSSARATTPRLLCTPRLTEAPSGLTGTDAPTSAWGPQANVQAGRKSTMRWQSSLTVDGMMPIVDSEPAHDAPVQPPARAVRPRPASPLDDTDVLDEDWEEYQKLAQRNMHTSVHLLVDQPKGTVDQATAAASRVGKQPAPVVTGRLPSVHKRDRPKQGVKARPTYSEWLQQQQQQGKEPGRRRQQIRDQLAQDPTIPQAHAEQAQQSESEMSKLLDRQAKKAAAMEARLAQRQRELARETAMANLQAAKSKGTTEIETRGHGLNDKAGADVFAFRPPTSRTGIWEDNMDMSLDNAAKAALARLKEKVAEERELESGRLEQQKLKSELDRQRLEEKLHKQKQLEAYKADLAKQIEYKNRLETTFKYVHPRQPVPFDVKHIPGNDPRMRGTNSAQGRRAAPLGPEMYREHDAREQKVRENAQKVYRAQVEFEARRNKSVQEQLEAERRADEAQAKQAVQEHAEDEALMKLMSKQEREALQQEWQNAKEIKLAREREEEQHRARPASIPIKDYMDYLSNVNDGFC
eukprot:TRINITY_DN9409_c0_g1_i2.p1 TRINITY_DN9409_c0_g1~~TRINITY_DN9409_c0_g1_i2.p1  ORF type:complete len:734 (+),score=132.36 TRINITY_DN9409_c0_g1_i2:54-2255(+)